MDLAALHSILIAGRQAAGGSYYVHTGDVNWWLFYINQDDDPDEMLHVWREGERVLGWSLLSPRFAALDVFVHPALRGTLQMAELWASSEARLVPLLREQRPDATHLRTMWVADDDDVLIALLEARGFALDPGYGLWCLERSLAEALPPSAVPDGFEFRPLRGAAEAEARALAARAAFGSQRPEAQYVERYRRFMASPVYADAVDLVAVTAGDQSAARVAAFALLWFDDVNKVGLFEPVGTHPDFQRRGLGRALLLDGLRRMRARGLAGATLCVEHDNLAAVKLYESAGFRPVRKLMTYMKGL